MALSNIRREPRREITESLVGIGLVSIPALAWVLASLWAAGATWNPNHMEAGHLDVAPYPAWVVFWLFWTLAGGFVAYYVGWLVLVITHGIGEGACNALASHGIELRPRNRPIAGRR